MARAWLWRDERGRLVLRGAGTVDGKHYRRRFNVPDDDPEFGEELRKEFKVFGERQELDPTMVTEVLDRAHTFIQDFSGTGLRSHRFLHGLLGYIRERHPDVAEQLARQTGAGGRIVIPSGFDYQPESTSS